MQLVTRVLLELLLCQASFLSVTLSQYSFSVFAQSPVFALSSVLAPSSVLAQCSPDQLPVCSAEGESLVFVGTDD